MPPIVHHIAPTAEGFFPYLREVVAASGLLRVLVRRDIMVRYKQTVVGVGWALLQPILMMLVYWFIFGFIARFPSEGLPYPVFVFAALLAWQYTARVIGEGGQSISTNASLITKVYFPRIVLPLSVAVSASLDLLIGVGLVLVLAPIFGYWPGWNLLYLPLYWAFAALCALGVATIVAPLEARYRDVRFVLPLLLQLWMLLSPVLYPLTMIPERLRPIFEANPVAVVVQGFRFSLLGQGTPPAAPATLYAAALVMAMLFSGLWLFRRSEHLFADRI